RTAMNLEHRRRLHFVRSLEGGRTHAIVPPSAAGANRSKRLTRSEAGGYIGSPPVRKRGPGMPRLYDATAEAIDRRIGWDKLPLPLAMLVLIGLRNVLRRKNLHDTGRGPLDRPDVDDHPRYMTARTLDGTFNNLDDPLMGSLGSRFGRNVPLEYTVRERDPLEPN